MDLKVKKCILWNDEFYIYYQERERQRKKMGAIKTVRYIDAQRDCAVEIGERDIRREIMRHRGR